MQTAVSSHTASKLIPSPQASRAFGGLDVIHAIVESQAQQRPHAIAVVCDAERLSYAELNARANQVAHRLRKHGVGPETMVGIYMERGVRTLVGILGILKAGGCYVPIDLQYPKDRVAFILENSGAKALVTDGEQREVVSEFNGPVVRLDEDYSEIADESQNNLPVNVVGKNAAYVIYTSGSTGRPKGVIVT